MIERYSRPQMKKVWSDESKFEKWLQVEIAVCEGDAATLLGARIGMEVLVEPRPSL